MTLLEKIKLDYPNVKFISSDFFSYSFSNQSINLNLNDINLPTLLLHELAHYCLKHKMFKYDIELLDMERKAWEYASNTLAPKYKVAINTECKEESIESYRNWIYERSKCPNCQSTGFQNKDASYTCIDCNTTWNKK